MLILQDRNGVPKCRVDPPNDLIFVSDTYKLYCAHGLEEPKDYIMRIPTNIGGNTQVNQEAEILRYLWQRSELLEQKYSEVMHDATARVHYDWLFPQLVDSFITDETQGSRQANLLSIIDGDVSDYVPMVKLIDKFKIDAKTAAWIFGRFLKLQAFLEDVGVIFNFRSDQVLIDPRRHRVVYLGWSQQGDPASYGSVKFAAITMRDWLEDNGTEHEEDFRKLLNFLIDNPKSSVSEGASAHRMLYDNLEKWWGHSYYPFTYFDRNTLTWHQINDAPNF